MNTKNIQDERVTLLRHKVNSEAYGIVMAGLIASILIQQLLLDAPFKQYAAEFICLLAAAVYITARYIGLGLNIYGEGKKRKAIGLTSALVTGLMVTAVNGIINYRKYAGVYSDKGIGLFIFTLLVTFVTSAILAFIVVSSVGYFSRKKEDKIQKRLDEEEERD